MKIYSHNMLHGTDFILLLLDSVGCHLSASFCLIEIMKANSYLAPVPRSEGNTLIKSA